MMRGDKILTRAETLGLARAFPGYYGICAQCGCTEGDACVESHDVGITWRLCHWATHDHALCDAAACLAAAANAAAASERAARALAAPRAVERK
jgi:hypothetical protein